MMEQLYGWLGFAMFWTTIVVLPFVKFWEYRCPGCGETLLSRRNLLEVCIGSRMWHLDCYHKRNDHRGEAWPES